MRPKERESDGEEEKRGREGEMGEKEETFKGALNRAVGEETAS